MVRSRDLTPAGVRKLYEAKARAELTAADALVPEARKVAGSGDLLAEVVLLKGTPGAEDRRMRRALAGPDGQAASKALEALGFASNAVWASCTFAGAASDDARTRRVRLLVEALDPRAVVALDAGAAVDLAAAFGLAGMPPGRAIEVLGRTLLAVGGLEASLGDPEAKARVWADFRALKGASAR